VSLGDSTMPRHRHIPARFPVHDRGVISEEGRRMRSLWRILALQWLGGDGSEALTEGSAILEGLLRSHERPMRAFDVRREPQASRQAMMFPRPDRPVDPEIPSEEALRSMLADRYSR